MFKFDCLNSTFSDNANNAFTTNEISVDNDMPPNTALSIRLWFGTGIRMREFCCCTENNANDRFITYIYNKEINKDVTKLDCNKLLMKMSAA